MNFRAILLSLQLTLTLVSTTHADPPPTHVLEAEVAKSDEFKEAKQAAAIDDGAVMLTKAKKLVERYPRSAVAHNLMAEAFEMVNFTSEAEAAARNAIAINPNDPVAWGTMGSILLKMQKIQNAETAFKNAVTVARTDPTSWANLGAFYGQQGNRTLGVHCAKQATALLSSVKFNDHYGQLSEAQTWRTVAYAFLQSGQPSEAITYLKRSISIRPDDPNAWVGLAESFSRSGKSEDAISAARQAVKLAPNNDVAKTTLQNLTEPSRQGLAAKQNEGEVTSDDLANMVEIAKKLQELRNLQEEGNSASSAEALRDELKALKEAKELLRKRR